MSKKTIKMLNKFGNYFTCPESEVEYWEEQGAKKVTEITVEAKEDKKK